eukprot:sb/3473566/
MLSETTFPMRILKFGSLIVYCDDCDGKRHLSHLYYKLKMNVVEVVVVSRTSILLKRLQEKAAEKGCRKRLQKKAAGKGCRKRLQKKAAEKGCNGSRRLDPLHPIFASRIIGSRPVHYIKSRASNKSTLFSSERAQMGEFARYRLFRRPF